MVLLTLQANTIIFPSELSFSSSAWTITLLWKRLHLQIAAILDSEAVHAQTRPSHIHFPTSEKFQEITFRQFSDFQINYI